MILSIHQNELNYTAKYFVWVVSHLLMAQDCIAFLRMLL